MDAVATDLYSDEEEEELFPLYSWGAGDDASKNLGCSSSPNQWCFFCQYQPGCSKNNEGDLRSHVRLLVDQSKDVSLIARSIKTAYDKRIRGTIRCEFQNNILEKPEWSLRQITKHLVCSGEFPSLFGAVQKRIYESMILRLNESIVDKNGRINHKERNALLSTMREYNSYCTKDEEPPAKKRKQ